MDQFYNILSVCVGALIAGLFTLIHNRRDHDRNMLKIKFENHKINIDEIIKSSQIYYSSCFNLVGAIDGVSKDIESNGQPSDDYKVFLRKADSRYDLGDPELGFCNAKLLILLGRDSPVTKKLWEYNDVIAPLRTKVFRSGEITVPSQQEMDNYITKLSELRTDFYVGLGEINCQ